MQLDEFRNEQFTDFSKEENVRAMRDALAQVAEGHWGDASTGPSDQPKAYGADGGSAASCCWYDSWVGESLMSSSSSARALA